MRPSEYRKHTLPSYHYGIKNYINFPSGGVLAPSWQFTGCTDSAWEASVLILLSRLFARLVGALGNGDLLTTHGSRILIVGFQQIVLQHRATDDVSSSVQA